MIADPAVIAVTVADGRAFVPVRICDRAPALLLLDTGIAVAVVDQAVLDRLGVVVPPGAGHLYLTQFAGGPVDLPLVRFRSLMIGPVTVAPFRAGIAPPGLNPDFGDGVLGTDVLGRFRMTLDLRAGELVLEEH